MAAAPGFHKEDVYVSLEASNPKKVELHRKEDDTSLHTMKKPGFLAVLVLN